MILANVQRWIWSDRGRCAHNLLRFSETEIDGGRDILRAAETTSDPLLRRLYLRHATDEHRHGQLFRRHASLLRSREQRSESASAFHWGGPGGHGLDDVRVEEETDETMLAFLHVAEKEAAARFETYRDAVEGDPSMQAIFEEILHDEKFHMNYTLTQLVRVAPERHRRRLWTARMNRMWKAYLRVATAVAGAIAAVILTIQYFVVVPLFAWLAKRAERREMPGWRPIARDGSPRSQY